MATEAPVYDLFLLLDTTLDDERRDTILANVAGRHRPAAARSSAAHDWGIRATATKCTSTRDADYHLLQFHGRRRSWSSSTTR